MYIFAYFIFKYAKDSTLIYAYAAMAAMRANFMCALKYAMEI